MSNYARHYAAPRPQSEKIHPDQQKNNAGGFAFVLDPFKRLERFLILGADGGTYYASERDLVLENAESLKECLKLDGPRTVSTIKAVSVEGRAPKVNATIFALAVATTSDDVKTRRAAYEALSAVCRTGSHLQQFMAAHKTLGRTMSHLAKKHFSRWYNSKKADELAYQLVKYQQRGGIAHRDILRLARPTPPSDAHQAAYRWAVGADLSARHIQRHIGGQVHEIDYPDVREHLPALLAAYKEMKQTTDPKAAAQLISTHKLTHEMVPTNLQHSPIVWEALLPHMPVGAMIRNLGRMSAIGHKPAKTKNAPLTFSLADEFRGRHDDRVRSAPTPSSGAFIGPMSQTEQHIVSVLGDAERLRKARIHPLNVLVALGTYQRGRGVRGNLSWPVSRAIVDALNSAFYLTFKNVEPTNKRRLIALDVSGSMTGPEIAGMPGITPRVGSAAMAMVTMRTEKLWHCVGFHTGQGCFSQHGTGSQYGWSQGIAPLSISAKQDLATVCKTVDGLPFSGTDCALPILYAKHRRIEVDSFEIYTDSETWTGNIHPHIALEEYRQTMGIDAKLIVVGMVSNGFSIANPHDPGMLDVVGFDTAVPTVMADFIRQ